MDDHTFLYQLNEALRGGGLGGQDPLRERYALDRYTDLVSEWLQEDLRNIDGERVTALNTDPAYPYWFADFPHECQGVTKAYLMVKVKEPWYHHYLNAMEERDGLLPDERETQSRQLPRDLSEYLKKIVDIQTHAPLN